MIPETLQRHSLPLCSLALIAAWSAMTLALPLLPIDETRYLTVAWEMRHNQSWILPLLNGVAYSHKPPMLFWLINLLWSIAGTHVQIARIVPGLAALTILLSTCLLSRRLYGPHTSGQAGFILLAMPAFMLYSAIIMFDLLMTVWIMAGIALLWRLAHKPDIRLWTVFGIVLGLGVLTKGPVIAIHLVPPALLVRFWAPDRSIIRFRLWLAGLVAALLVAMLLSLAWAIPAAMEGGKEFAEMIFWRQSAGRMVNAFDHAQPVWFYVPVVLLYILPMLTWPPLWRGLSAIKQEPLLPGQKLALSWIAPAFAVFCLMSGKQAHYILPLLPGLALFLQPAIGTRASRASDIAFPAILFALLFTSLMIIPLLPANTFDGERIIAEGLAHFSIWPFVLGLTLSMLAFIALRHHVTGQLAAMTLSVLILQVATASQASNTLFKFFDLNDLAQAVQPYKGKPIAFVRKYAGELGYLARLEHPVETMEFDALPQWFANHPDGHAIIRYDDPRHTAQSYDILFSMPYKGSQFLSIVAPPTGATP